MSNSSLFCGGGWFAYPPSLCAPCPPHTIGLDGVNCVRCPDDAYALGFGNIACSPCLNSNYTTDALACPVVVPQYYYAAVSGTGIALLLLVLLIAAVCVVQQRSGMLSRLKIKIDSMAMVRRLIGTNNEEAAESVGYDVVDGIMNADQDDADHLEPRVVRTADASTLVLDDDGDGSILPEESVVDFENTGDLSQAVVTVNPPPPPGTKRPAEEEKK